MMMRVILEVVRDAIEISVDKQYEGGCSPLYWAVGGFPTTWLEIHPLRLQKSIKHAPYQTNIKLAFLNNHQFHGNMDENDWRKRKQIEFFHRNSALPKGRRP